MWFARFRSAITLAGLALVLVVAVSYALSAVSEPFPERADPPPCSGVKVTEGEFIFPDQVTVTVLNSSNRGGLASSTMSQFEDATFGRGTLANAPDGSNVKRAEIWTTDPSRPDVKLVASWLGKKKTDIVRRDEPGIGVNVVVGDNFNKLRKGRKRVKVTEAVTICSPPTVSDPGPDADEL